MRGGAMTSSFMKVTTLFFVAIGTIAFLGCEESRMDRLLQEIHAPSASRRIEVVVYLAQLHNNRAVEPLVQALEDTDPGVRNAAAWALGEIKTPEAVHALENALGHWDAKVCAQAQKQLLKQKRTVSSTASSESDNRLKGF